MRSLVALFIILLLCGCGTLSGSSKKGDVAILTIAPSGECVLMEDNSGTPLTPPTVHIIRCCPCQHADVFH
jgi:hypothetical protein